MSIYFRKTNILDPYSWTTGSGSFTGFYQNGSTIENERVMGVDPWGNSVVVWESRPTGGGDADGGWETTSFNINEKKLYRFSVWVKRTSDSAGGTSYFGLYGQPNPVIRLNGLSQEGNPYWDCSGTGGFTKDVWYLIVGHAFPSDYLGGLIRHADSGSYIISGANGDINFCNISGDVKWYPGSTTAVHRTYHYYCPDNTTRLQWYDPRVDLCDGSEPTISDLLNNRRNVLESTTITPEGASFKNQKIIASGGDITHVGEWRIHRFNSSGTFTLTSLIGSSLPVEYLIVGGGGGGGMDMGGGGGGGGVLNGNAILTKGSYTITVGAGGAGAPAAGTNGQPTAHQYTISATNGGNSSALGLTAYGGGYGGSSYFAYTPNNGYGGNGANGGGASGYSDGNTGRGGTGNQGYNGGGSIGQYYSGGGGGAGGNGGVNPGTGGIGKMVNILGRPFYWGGGGGGAGYSSIGGKGGYGGGGGGAIGDTNPSGTNSIMWGIPGTNGASGTQANVPGGDAGTNTGGGGGGGSHYNSNNKGGNGGSGIVIIRYKIK